MGHVWHVGLDEWPYRATAGPGGGHRGCLVAQRLPFSTKEILTHSQHGGYQDQECGVSDGIPMGRWLQAGDETQLLP